MSTYCDSEGLELVIRIHNNIGVTIPYIAAFDHDTTGFVKVPYVRFASARRT